MRTPSPAAEALADRLIAAACAPHAGGPARGERDACEHALDQLSERLARWFGAFGYHALLVRALAHARREHPALAAVTAGEPHAPALGGLDDAARAHGTEATAAGARAVLTAVLAVLGRVIGDDMILYLVEPRMDDTAPEGPAITETSGRPVPPPARVADRPADATARPS